MASICFVSRSQLRTFGLPHFPSKVRMCDQNHPNNHVLIFGLGYVGSRLAHELHHHNGFKVSAVAKKSSLQTTGYYNYNGYFIDEPSETSSLQTFLKTTLPTVTSIVTTVAPHSKDEPRDSVYDSLYPFLGNDEKQLAYASNLKSILYLSSTSVYGDNKAGIVSETSATNTRSTKALNRLASEHLWKSLYCNVLVLRLSGIYGPNRSILHTLTSNKIVSNGNDDKIVNRVHVDDIVAVIQEALVHPVCTDYSALVGDHRTVNVSDNLPASRAEVSEYAYCLLRQLGWKDFAETDEVNGNERSKNRTSKKISNCLMKQVFLQELKYPTFKEGLQSIAKDEFTI